MAITDALPVASDSQIQLSALRLPATGARRSRSTRPAPDAGADADGCPCGEKRTSAPLTRPLKRVKENAPVNAQAPAFPAPAPSFDLSSLAAALEDSLSSNDSGADAELDGFEVGWDAAPQAPLFASICAAEELAARRGDMLSPARMFGSSSRPALLAL